MFYETPLQSGDLFFYFCRKVLVFQRVDFGRYRLRRIGFGYRHAVLSQDVAAVVALVDAVDRNSCFPVSGLHDRAVHPVSVHALAAVARQQGRMDVYDPVRVSGQQIFGYQPQESGQYDVIDLPSAHQPDDPVAIIKGVPVEYDRFDLQFLGAAEYFGIRSVGQYQFDAGRISGGEVAGDVFRVGTRPGCENGYFLRF